MMGPSSHAVREGGTMRIVSGPVSLTTLTFWAVVIFAAGFWHGRYLSELENSAVLSRGLSVAATPAVSASSATATPTPVPQNESRRVTVTIRLLKFSPETIELNRGDVVEWANKDLTPHTATSSPESGSHELDSGSINAGASWEHQFTTPGTFPYFCTFHPEMKGVVLVK